MNLQLPLSLLLTFSSTFSFAEDIYRQETKSGSVSYSNKAGDSNSVIATLPGLVKQKNVFNSENKAIASCSAHGGFDCTKGADTDGSVICYDGFKESLQRFAFSCNKSKLELIEQSVKIQPPDTSFVIRNLSSVLAKNVTVKSSQCSSIDGPTEIPAYDSSEFFCKGELKNPNSLKIDCDNC